MTETITLPSIDGKPLIKQPSKSTDRHAREIAAKVAKLEQLSTTQYRRAKFIIEHGSPEIQQLVREDKLSIWRAYNYVRRQYERNLFLLVEAELENLPSIDGKEASP